MGRLVKIDNSTTNNTAASGKKGRLVRISDTPERELGYRIHKKETTAEQPGTTSNTARQQPRANSYVQGNGMSKLQQMEAQREERQQKTQNPSRASKAAEIVRETEARSPRARSVQKASTETRNDRGSAQRGRNGYTLGEKRSQDTRVGKAAQSIALNTIGSTEMLGEGLKQANENVDILAGDQAYSRLRGQYEQMRRQLNGAVQRYGMDSTEAESIRQSMNGVREQLTARRGEIEKGIDTNSHAYRTAQMGQEAASQALEGLSGVGGFLGETALSIADNASLMPLAAINPALPLVIMSIKAAGGRAKELTDQGKVAGEALSRGTVSGIIEGLSENVSLGSLLEMVRTGGRGWLVNLLKQAGVEGAEEITSYLANYAMDKAAQDPNAQFDAGEMLRQGASGALSGLVFGGVGTAVNRLNGYRGADYSQVDSIQGDGAPSAIERSVQNVRQTLAAEGQSTFDQMRTEGQDPSAAVEYTERFVDAYNKGKRNESIPQAAEMTEAEAETRAAWNAGRVDALTQEGARNKQNQATREAGAGVIRTEYTDSLDQKTVSALDRAAKQLGVTVEFADEVAGGSANAEIQGNRITIEKWNQNPVRALFGHEITHRIQELSADSYAEYKAAVQEVMGDRWALEMEATKSLADQYGLSYSEDQLADEVVADYAGELLQNDGTLERFIQTAQSKPTLLQRMAQVFRDLVNKLRGTEKAQAERALGKLEKAYLEAAKAEKSGEAPETAYSLKRGDGGRAAAQEQITAQYQQSVHNILNGTEQGKGALLVGYTPEIYKKLGMPELPFVVGSGHVYSMAKTISEAAAEGKQRRGVNYHGLGENVVADILEFVKDPVMVIAAKDVDAAAAPLRSTHSVVALVDVGTGKSSLVIPVAITAERTVDGIRMDVNAISSAYEKNTTALVNEAIAQFNSGEDSIFYIKKEAANLIGAGVQFPEQLKAAASSNGIVRELGAKINMSIQNVTQTQQFNRWFGDWQNHPENASKVVNEDGTPKVVYHGTNAEFYTFRQENGAYFFSESLDYAESMAEERGGSRVVEAYISMKKPYTVTLEPGAFTDNIAEAPYIRYAKENGYDGVIFESGADKNDLAYDRFYVVFDPAQIKSATDNVGTFDPENPDIRFSRKTTSALFNAYKDINQRLQAGEITQEQATQEKATALDRIYTGYVQSYGEMAPGENPARKVSVPKQTSDTTKVSQTIRTIMEAKATPESILPTLKESIANGDFDYETYTDAAAKADAEKTIRDVGWDKAQRKWFNAMENGIVTKENTALGWTLYNNAVNSGNTELAIDVLNQMVKSQRNAAQALQATRILKQLSPEGQLYQVQRSVADLQKEINNRYRKDGAPKLEIDKDLAKKLMEAQDQNTRDKVLEEIYKDIGRQMPSRFIDKWNAWRYLAMLGNPRTHVRNIVGNAGFMPVVGTKNLIAQGIETVASKFSPGMERTKGTFSAKLFKAALADYANIEGAAMGGGKYSDFAAANKYVEEGRQIFGSRALETLRRKNGAALDAEDVWFSKPHYANAMAQYCKANGITAEQIRSGDEKVLRKARAYAVQEAAKATYRDTNALSEAVSSIGGRWRTSDNKVKRVTGTLVEGILPFRKTPANILARGLEYSPAGLLKGLTNDLVQVKKGNMTAAQAIDNISAGLTGTGLLAMGAYLAAQGLLRGGGSGDDDKDQMDDLAGRQDYSLEIGDTSVTLDWLAPEALPLFVGANLYETWMANNGEMQLSDYLNAIKNVSEPMVEMSCLQSLDDVFNSVATARYSGKSALTAVLVSAATSYLTQVLPTILGQAERTSEPLRMTTYTSKGKFATTDVQYFLGKSSARIPVLWDYQQIPYIDAWGRTESNGTTAERAFNNFINPAYVSTIRQSDMEKEIERLYEATEDGGVVPDRADKSIKLQEGTKYLSPQEYVTYAQEKGKKSYALAEELVNSAAYQAADDTRKADMIRYAYQYATAVAKTKVSDYALRGWQAKCAEVTKKTGLSEATYITLYLEQLDVEGYKDEDGDPIANSAGLQKMEVVYNMPGLTDAQRSALFGAFGVGKKVAHYNKAKVSQELDKLRTKER